MMFYSSFLCISLSLFIEILGGQTDSNELPSIVNQKETPVRVPSLAFNKDRLHPQVEKRIIGGGIVNAHSYPFTVALYIYVHITEYFCGGSLITPLWILTAAHCMEHSSMTTVVLGSHLLNETEPSRVVINTTEYIIHEKWNSAIMQYDVALIKLPEKVDLNEYVNTVSVTSSSDLYTGLMTRTLGWGITTIGFYSDVLRYVDSVVISNDNCSTYEDYGEYIVDQHLCTSGEGFVGSCSGDSGGPILIDGVQIGIVSFGHTNCLAGFPSINVRLTHFSRWINETIENYGKPPVVENSGSMSKPKHLLFVYLFVVSCNLI